MRSSRRAVKGASLLLTWLLCACSGGGTGSNTPGINPNRHDGGSQPDGPSRDGGNDGGNDVVVGDLVLCRYDDSDVYELPASDTLLGLSSATDERGFALLHHDQDGSLVIEAAAVGDAAEPTVRLVPSADAPGRSLIAASGHSFAMLWMDEDALAVRLLESGAGLHVLSDALAVGGDGAPIFAFVGTSEGYWAAYAERAGSDVVVKAQAIDPEGELDGEAVTVALPEGSAPEHLELAKLDRGFLLAFSEADPDDEDAKRVMGLVLTERLEPRDEAVLLSKSPVGEWAFSLGSRTGSAGVIYQGLEGGVRPTIKLQRVESTGEAAEDSLNIASAPRRVIDGSIAAFGQGYAVAYRALGSLGSETPAIHIAFVNQFGLVVHDATLSETSETSGATSVTATTNGELLVSWIHVDGGAYGTRAIQLDCPGALVLCGGHVD